MKTLTMAAQTSKAIRKTLKEKFPQVKFRVNSKNYSMGNSVTIHYQDGPAHAEVDKIVRIFQYGHFDGMTDCYEYSNYKDDMPQAKHVFVNRQISDKYYDLGFKYSQVYFNFFNDVENMDEFIPTISGTARNYIWRILNACDLTKELTYTYFIEVYKRI